MFMADDPTPHLERFASYERACREFRWQLPASLNIADVILSRHPDAVTRVALVEVKPGGLNTYTYGGLDYLSDKFATVLDRRGVRRGDSIAIIVPQSAAAIIAQLGALKLGAVVVPLSITLDASVLGYALKDSGARALVIHHTSLEISQSIMATVETVFVVNKLRPEFEDISPDFDFWREVFEASPNFTSARTPHESQAFVFYVATTEDRPVPVTHSHASLTYQLPAFEMCNNFRFTEDSVFWTPEDWASVDSLLCWVYPALWYGCLVVADDSSVAGDDAWSLIDRCEITNLFASRGQFDALRQSSQPSLSRDRVKLRNFVLSEAGSAQAYDWAKESLGASVNTRLNDARLGSVASSCNRWHDAPPGSVGRAAPGYIIETVDGEGRILSPRIEGRLAIRRDEPRAPVEAAINQSGGISDTEESLVGDPGFKDEDGNIWLLNGRAD
jgi:acetyl-CoA synthetase